jgi:hypothetical protein
MRIRIAFLWLTALIVVATPAHARRVALVIGNAAYTLGPLANPVNDAEAIGDAFRDLGFAKVIRVQNATKAQMEKALGEMARESQGAEMAVVFFAGHGTERDGRNYLIPVDAKLDRASELDLQAIALPTVLDQIAGATKLKLVILDACRNTIFPLAGNRRSATRGLARIEPEDNTLVAYAAKDGTVAADGAGQKHSPFTTALLKHMPTPGTEISFVFRSVRDAVMGATERQQQPHTYGTLGGEPIYLVPPTTVAPGMNVGELSLERQRLADERRRLEAERKRIAELQKEVVPPAIKSPDTTSTSRMPLPSNIPTSANLEKAFGEHPFFRDAPIIRLKSYSTETRGGAQPGASSVQLTQLRPGLAVVEEQQRYTVSGAYTTNSNRTISTFAWLDLGSTHASVIRFSNQQTNRTFSTFRTLSFELPSASFFPLLAGKEFNFKYVTEHVPSTGGSKHNQTIAARCRVGRESSAAAFHASLTGRAWIIKCAHSLSLLGNTSTSSLGFVYFESLGFSLSVDPQDRSERIVDGGSSTILTAIELVK